MPVLKKKVDLVEVTLPVSGAVCRLGFTWGEKNSLQKKLYTGMSYDLTNPQESVKQVDALALHEQGLESILVGLKEWDFTEENGEPLPITLENIGLLCPEDGDFLGEKITAILHPKKDDTERKKG